MPGLATLRARGDALDVRYRALAAGAEIRIRANDPDVVEAVHAWFQAQLDDHGAHAEGHGSG